MLAAGCGNEAEPAAKTQPRGHPSVGIAAGGTLEFSSPADLARELDGYVELGAGWVRIDLRWHTIEPRRGAYRWERYDRVVDAALARGLRVLAILAYAPDWAAPGGDDSAIDPAEYVRFVDTAVRRYSPRGVHDYELWNEPNSEGFWHPVPNAEAYAGLVRAAYPAIKEADPAATVVAGALAPVGGASGAPCEGNERKVHPVRFLEDLYAAGAGGSFDAVSYHPYSMPKLPGSEDPCNAWAQLEAADPSLRSVMEREGDGDKRIWATEFGARVDLVGEWGQRSQIVAALDEWPRFAWAGPLMVYAYRDQDNKQWNLVREDWSPRPAWHALREALARTGR